MKKNIVSGIKVGSYYWCCLPFFGVYPVRVKYIGDGAIELAYQSAGPTHVKKLRVHDTVLHNTRVQALEAKKSELQATALDLVKQLAEVHGVINGVQCLINEELEPKKGI